MEIIKLKSELYAEKFKEYANIVLEGGYHVSDADKNDFRILWHVFFNSNDSLLICGDTGCSKTLTMQIIQRIINPQSNLFFKKVSCSEIVDEYESKGRSCFEKYLSGNWLFDDLGNEPLGNHYQSKIEVMEELIGRIYDVSRITEFRYIFTTNLHESKFKERYGDRTHSRLYLEMAKKIVFGKDGVDKRNLRNFKGLPLVYHERIKTDEEIKWEEDYKKFKEESIKKEYVEPNYEGGGSRLRDYLNFPKKEVVSDNSCTCKSPQEYQNCKKTCSNK